jgi:Short C-terminal domain
VTGGTIRADIDEVIANLDPKGRASLDGIRVPRAVRKGLQNLPELIPDERVIALAVGKDSNVPGGNLGDVAQVTKSIRLLVVTELNFWEVQATGRLNGGRPKGICTSLADISDVRVLSERKLSRFGTKERMLGIDHLRGAQVDTLSIEVLGGDETLDVFAGALVHQVRAIGDALAAAERSSSGGPASVADELSKLSELRQGGVLSDVEFEAQKARLLQQ